MKGEKARGTAIGDAIFYAKNYIKETSIERKIVVIGDGDNTAGNILPEMAAQIAKNHHIKIFSIGIGKKGLVPFGKDQFGRPQMVDNTFQDTTLKNIASATGGEYFWAKDSDDLVKILKRIFPD
jgi:Ca-activated chloride channel family protein